jgi:hypothetical protein
LFSADEAAAAPSSESAWQLHLDLKETGKSLGLDRYLSHFSRGAQTQRCEISVTVATVTDEISVTVATVTDLAVIDRDCYQASTVPSHWFSNLKAATAFPRALLWHSAARMSAECARVTLWRTWASGRATQPCAHARPALHKRCGRRMHSQLQRHCRPPPLQRALRLWQL